MFSKGSPEENGEALSLLLPLRSANMRDFLDGAALINDFHVQQRRMAVDARNRLEFQRKGGGTIWRGIYG